MTALIVLICTVAQSISDFGHLVVLAMPQGDYIFWKRYSVIINLKMTLQVLSIPFIDHIFFSNNSRILYLYSTCNVIDKQLTQI